MGKAARLKAAKMRQRNPLITPFPRPAPGEEIFVAFNPGLTVHDGIEAMKKQTHDDLIRQLGAKRRSGIRWRIVHGPAEAKRLLRLMYSDDIERWTLVVGNYFPFITQHGDETVMIVAECDAIR